MPRCKICGSFRRLRLDRPGQYQQCRKCHAPSLEKRLFDSARHRANASGIPFTISQKDITIPEFCPIFNIPLRKGTKWAGDNSPSLDRRVNELGYIPGNVCVISWKANRRKANLTRDEILALARYVG